MKEIISTADAPQAIGAYSQAVKANGFIFLSGQLALDPKTGGLVPGDVADQAAQVFKNIAAVLAAAGSGMSRIVKATIFLKDIGDFDKVNEIYAGNFSADFPARSCVEVSRLPKDALIEIEVIAV
jgi:2-iminobutanoate/2-iminopropanoate deaminase